MLVKKSKIHLIVLSLLLIFAVAEPQIASARGLVPCGGYKDDSGSVREPDCNVAYIFIMIARVTNWLIAVSGLYAIFKIIQAGLWMIVSMGKEETITQKKDQISNAVVGFVMVLMAFMFVNMVINYTFANQKPGFTVDLTKPLCYLNPNEAECTKPK